MPESYVDILNDFDVKLSDQLQADEAMPDSVKEQTRFLVDQLKDLLWPYSD